MSAAEESRYPGLTLHVHDGKIDEVLAAAQAAQDASLADSNDDEIDLLRTALDVALGALGLDLPEGREP